MKLTKDVVAWLTIPAGKADHIVWDDELPGFGIRLRGTSRVFIVQYRHDLRQRRESLGDVRKIKLDDARKIARQRFASIELGVDPAAEKAKARRAQASALALGSVADRYLAAKKSPDECAHQPRSEEVFRNPLEAAAPSIARYDPARGRRRPASRAGPRSRAHGRVAGSGSPERRI